MKKFFSALLLLAGSFVLFQPTAHASLILSQDIYEVDIDNDIKTLIGSFSINIADSEQLFDSEFQILNWFKLTLFGTSFEQNADLGDYFAAQFLIDDLAKGVFFLSFDVLNPINNSAYSLFYDVLVGETGALTIFSLDQGQEPRFLSVSLGDARIQVPAPATLALLLLGMIGLAKTRRSHIAKR